MNAREAYWGISDYIKGRYPERKSIIRGYHSGDSPSRHALHFTAMLSNSRIWEDILTVSDFIQKQKTGRPPDVETFNLLVRRAKATLLTAESDVEIYLALRATEIIERHDWNSGNYSTFAFDLWRLKKKFQARLRSRLSKRVRTKWPLAFRQRLFEIQGAACAGCGAKFNSYSAMALDHIETLVYGGADAPGNLQLLCHPCNGTKSVDGMWHLKKRLEEEKRITDRNAADQAHTAALSFTG